MSLTSAAPQPQATTTHFRQLDALRTFAVALVLVHHYLPGTQKYGEWGSMGVQVFFVISGFLITTILLGCKRAVEGGQSIGFTLRQFYARRFLRIFPLYYLVIFLGAAINASDIRQKFWWYVTYTINYQIAFSHTWSGLAHFWSLAVEEQFYLIWPLVILSVPRNRLLAVIIATIMIGPLSRAVLLGLHSGEITLTVLTPSCLDSLGLGSLLALCEHAHLARLKSLLRRLGLWVGFPLLVLIISGHTLNRLYKVEMLLFNTAVGLLSVWLVIRTVEGVKGVAGRVLDWKPVLYLGTISYGLYVYHIPVLKTAGESYMDNSLMALLFSGVTVLVASVSWFMYERPINELKRFFPYRKKPDTPRADDMFKQPM